MSRAPRGLWDASTTMNSLIVRNSVNRKAFDGQQLWRDSDALVRHDLVDVNAVRVDMTVERAA